ncbi:unnamed protein product [Didymodactylos carnosus]|uniref:G-protein coupled receptors family 1 profile domain-containing protein n=1 Tax=Didymodactylos carnosus TaxID=1234261 RepID=A0A8S2DLP3_9BILA|nr:unnamed protein product [Didymodactylos carnosus]CAF3755029.1 unnamed protein product [Didymodactylos carnosus]
MSNSLSSTITVAPDIFFPSSTSPSSPFSVLAKFGEYYSLIHGRIVFPLTIFGIITSIVTIVILNRKHFQTPTNLILQHIALFDLIVLISYNIFSFYFYILHTPKPFVGQSRFWPSFALFHSNVGLTAHSIALWLTCLLDIVRYFIVSQPNKSTLNSRKVMYLIWSCIIVICFLMIPNYLIWTVVKQPASIHYPDIYSLNSSVTVYWFSNATGKKLERVSFNISAIFLKILPVCILITFSLLLIHSIHSAQKLRQRLQQRSKKRRYSSSMGNFTRELRTTTMLVFITVFTVLVEAPQGLLFIASAVEKKFFLLYSLLGDILDLSSIASSFITFIMYCSMSQQFRLEMYHLILPQYCHRLFLSQNHMTNNCVTTKLLTKQNHNNQNRSVEEDKRSLSHSVNLKTQTYQNTKNNNYNYEDGKYDL